MSDMAATSHPFIYGRPVQPDEFVGRKDDLRSIFNRLRTGQSTAVTGLPHIGKSSLLFKLADAATQQDYLGTDAQGLIVSPLNLHDINPDYSPISFWEAALKPLRERSDHTSAAQLLKQSAENGFTGDSLKELFDYLHTQGQHLVLLLDEFERLLFHSNFCFDFFATLRGLASFPGFSFITASCFSLRACLKNRHI